MKRSLAKKFAAFCNLDCDLRSKDIEIDYVEQSTELDDVLKEIFSVDPISGLPKGDIQYFLSKDGNPQVKAWLETNLLSPRATMSGSSIEGVTDDFIAEYARNDGENYQDYALRLRGYFDTAKAEFDKLNAGPLKQE